MLIQLETHYSRPKPRSLFYSYSHKDEGLRDELDAHLTLLKRDGFISTWHDRRIRPGDQWDSEISDALNHADVILFLVSPHFLASRYCRDVEVRRAMERYRSREALVIPIILKPVVFSSEEFAKLQALPKNCRPLIEWPDSGFAAVAEELRTLMVDLHFPQSPRDDPFGHHGSWILKLESRSNEDDHLRAERVVSRLQRFTADYSMSLQATSVTQVADGEEIKTGLMLILAGSAKAFAATEKAHKSGRLSSILDDKVLQFYIIHGATVQGQSRLGTSADISEAEGLNLLLGPGRKVSPARLRGINLPKGDAGSMQFFFDRGDTGFSSDAERDREYRKLADYFKTSTAIPDGDQWVNLSAFEADRMLPKELTGTALGRALLSQDCMLKRLTASLMHPDSAVGREYWNAVYAEARKRFGNSKMQFQSFQKVWIIPSEAAVYEADGDEPQHELTNDDELHRKLNKLVHDFGLAPGNKVVTILRNRLSVQCEADFVARKEVLSASEGLPLGVHDAEPDFALKLFREIVLPRIEEEVNEGEHFTEIRQIYSAMVLATWVKNVARETGNSRVKALADSGTPGCMQMSMGSVSALGGFVEARVPAPNEEHSWSFRRVPLDHAEPLSPAFDVPENAEFYQIYINLFRNGVFRCARNEAGDGPDERVIRVYFSGAINLQEIPLRVQNPLDYNERQPGRRVS